ncbi:VOC family protein [Corallococcus exiguus]|uniref:VOC family protein n=1 Tax=Corallococcus exiguus TaxID=83462 RepID=UPI001493F8E6|nr:VOC family protein [Corallococcus exiguus]
MFDHIGLRVKDLPRSIQFYQSVLVPLGYVLCHQDATSAGFGPKGQPALWLYPASDARSTGHVAFRASERTAVDRFHAAGISAGGSDHGAPGIRTDYADNYYAAFLIDPDGNNVEAVCLT